MAEEDLFKKGFSESFEDIFDEDKFNERQKYATFIFWVAVVVEVFASAIGFFFATSTGYNAYDQIPEKERTTSTLIYAIQGSLPFFLVAVIEPLKIPLAGGLYYVRSVGWRILIFMALLGLTVVTFETMLTSFEQNLTNVNGSVIKQNNLIEKINGDLKNLKEEQAELNKDDEDGVTLKIKKLNDDLNQQRKDELNKLEEKLKSNISPLQKSKDQNLIKLSSLTTDINTADKLKIDNLKDQLREQEQNREKIIQKAANDIEKYLQTIQGASNLKSQEKDKKISDYKQEIKNKKSERDVLQNKIISIKGELAEKLNKIDEDEKETIKKIELEEKLEVEKINKENFIVGNKITLARKFYESKKNEERSKAQSKREREEARLNTVIKSNTQNLQKINIDINNLEKRILDLQSVNVEIKSADQSKIDQINKDRDNKVKNIDKLINQLNSSITQKINSTLGRNNSEINEIKQENKIIDKKINDELNFKIKEEQRISKEYGEKIDENNNRLAEEINRLSDNRKNKIPQIETQIIQLNEKLAKAKEEKRIKSQANQVYRLAAWYYNQKDIADVTKKQLDFIAFIWFGSIAFVAATIGTVLALTHYIMRDPNNYIKPQKRKRFRRLYLGLAIIIRKITVLIWTLIKVLGSLSRVIFSFAEIFRGSVGKPLQRSIRSTGVAIRKRMRKPKIVEKIVEKEIEIEKPVEVIKEVVVEKPVEVIKEVPVEKVEIKEVPKEIVRKEIVYVPLYSAEKGLVDAPQSLKDEQKKK